MLVGKDRADNERIIFAGLRLYQLYLKALEREINNDFNGKIIDWPTETKRYDTIEDFTEWIIKTYLSKENIDYIVGHSMGGLVALNVARRTSRIKNIILLESYLNTPSPFFRNIVMDNTSDEIISKILNMLNNERENYSEVLKNKLRDINMISFLNEINSMVNLIYGDRGINNKNKIKAELDLPVDLISNQNISIISDSCHFPMIENPEETKIILKKLIM